MSLVGKLQDLGLGDVLQVVGFSRKSGVLEVETQGARGEFFLQGGRVVAAAVSTGPVDLHAVLVGGRHLSSEVFEAIRCEASARSCDFRSILIERELVPEDRLDALCCEAIEVASSAMFGWTEGEFRFQTGACPAPQNPRPIYPAGLDVQHLAMVAACGLDESGPASVNCQADDLETLSDHEGLGCVQSPAIETEKITESGGSAQIGRKSDLGILPSGTSCDVMIVLDPDPVVLEGVKRAARHAFSVIHVFQQADPAMARIRQYLVRRRFPVVLVAPGIRTDRLGGIQDAHDFMIRMKEQSTRLRALWLCADRDVPAASEGLADGIVMRPPLAALLGSEGGLNSDFDSDDRFKQFRSSLEALAPSNANGPLSRKEQPEFDL